MIPLHTTRSLLLASILVAACSRGHNAPTNEAGPPAVVTPHPSPAANGPAAPTQPLPDLPEPNGPRADVHTENFTLGVALAPVAAVPGDSTLSIELHGQGGYHVNDHFPTAVDLETRNATMARTTLRRGDAAELTEAGARFSQPVHVTATGPAVRGRIRFAVCNAEHCVPEVRTFAVNLP